MLRTPLIRLVSMLMAILLLASSTGFIVVEHNCQMRGVTRSLWSGEESCKTACAEPAKSAGQYRKEAAHLHKQPCCEETTLLSRADITATIHVPDDQQAQVSSAISVTYPVSGWLRSCLACPVIPDRPPGTGPPALSASRYIALLCVWLL